MSHIDKLDVTNRVLATAHPRHKTESVDYRRKKLIANLEEQIELVALSLANKPMQLQRKRGHDIVKVRPRIWWRTFPDGEVFTEIRYNKIAINFDGRGTSIRAGSLKKLPAIYRTVIRAVKAGELDQAIENIGTSSKD